MLSVYAFLGADDPDDGIVHPHAGRAAHHTIGPDADLVARVRAGDDTAFAEVFRAQYLPLVEMVASYVGVEEDAKEIVAELFAWLHRHRAAWEAPVGVRAYLFRAARNRALNYLRDRQREGKRYDLVAREARETTPLASTTAPDDLLEQQEDTLRVRIAVVRALAELPPKAREVAALRWQCGLSTAEIATILGLSHAAVHMHVSRALKVLRERLPALLA